MNNPFLTGPRDLMKSWKELRSNLTFDMTDREQLDTVVGFWSKAPIKNPYMDYLQPELWPDAWALLDSNDFDQNSLALGMFHTLMLSPDNRWQGRLSLQLIRRHDESMERLVLIADGKYLLNYYHNGIVSWPLQGQTTVMHRYAYDASKRRLVER